ncbi:MAG: hypothetical protein WCQ95_00140 [Bacteroidota bacterium]
MRYFFFAWLITSGIASYAQSDFEGVITYKIDIIPNRIISLKHYNSDTMVVYMKEGNYKQVYPNAKSLYSVTYVQSENKMYYFSKNYDTIIYKDAAIVDDTVVTTKRNDSITQILGYNCKDIAYVLKHKKIVYYYAEQLPINPDYFKNYNTSCYNTYANDSKSVYLKLIISTAEADIIFTALKIEQKLIDDSEFKLPPKPLKMKE